MSGSRLTQLEDLSTEQRSVVENWGQGMAVLAGAGSGKTTTLVIKCAELLKRDPEARFAAVSFTEKSASDIRQKLSERLSSEDMGNAAGGVLSGHWVMTIHGLCGAILREYPRQAGYDGEESMLSEAESQLLWERAIEQIWADEAQPEIEAALSRMLGRESRDSLWSLLKRARDLNSLGILDSLAKSPDQDSQALSVLANFVLERYDRLKRRRGALDFNDLERGADRALEDPVVREAYQKRFDLVLVDEFQDTNPVQARIILRFVKPDRSNLCVVGDPKQSIYRFRDADVSVFEEFCSKLPVRISLTRNHRSRPGVLSFANSVCERAFEASQMGYEPLIPHRQAGQLDPVLKLNVRAPQELASWILGERARGVPLEDMALLLRKIRGNERWLKALTSAGIPIAVGSGGLFWEDPRVRELVAFLKWWDHPANSLSGAIFLRAPWVAVADEELDRWIKRDPSWVEPFFASGHPLARALSAYRGKIVRPGELILALLINDGIEAEIGACALGLWHRAEELSSRGLDFRGVIIEMSLACEERRRERDVPPPRNQGQLSVLTVHGSKGLEFPHVILVDLGKKSREPNSPTLFWDRHEGAYLVEKDLDGERIDTPKLAEWKAREQAKERAENKRVFYVALTRAKERLVLTWPELPEKDAKIDPERVYSQDFWRGWIESSGALSGARELEAGNSGFLPGTKASNETRASFRRVTVPHGTFTACRPRHSVTEWNLLARCPRAYEWKYVRARAGEKRTFDRIEDWGVSTGEEGEVTQRELGTEVHACLETGDFGRLEELEFRVGSDRFKARVVRDWAERSSYMNLQAAKAWSELSFEIPIAGEVLVGSMDRVVEGSSGLTVVDFKVTRHEKTSETLLEAYRTQMELYRFALSRLHGEVAPGEISAVLVNFSDSGVQEVRVQAGGFKPEALAHEAARIVAGDEGIPRPSSLCELCQFASCCDVRNSGSSR